MSSDGRRMSLEVEETMFVQRSRWSWKQQGNSSAASDQSYYNGGYMQDHVYPYMPTSAQDDGYLRDISSDHYRGAVFMASSSGLLREKTYDITNSGQMPVQTRDRPNRENTPDRQSQYISSANMRMKPFKGFVGPPHH